jgi:hypothetical protein
MEPLFSSNESQREYYLYSEGAVSDNEIEDKKSEREFSDNE